MRTLATLLVVVGLLGGAALAADLAPSSKREEPSTATERAAIAHVDALQAELNKEADEIYRDAIARLHLAPGEKAGFDRTKKVWFVFPPQPSPAGEKVADVSSADAVAPPSSKP